MRAGRGLPSRARTQKKNHRTDAAFLSLARAPPALAAMRSSATLRRAPAARSLDLLWGGLGLKGGDDDAIQSARSGAASLFSSAPRVGAARMCGRSRRRRPLGRRGGGHNCWCCCLVSLPLPAHGFRSKSGTPLCMLWRPWPDGPWRRCSLSLRAESAGRLLYQEHTRALALFTVKQVPVKRHDCFAGG